MGPSKDKKFKGKYKAKLEFLGEVGGGGGWRGSRREVPPGSMDIIFLEQHIHLISTGSSSFVSSLT